MTLLAIDAGTTHCKAGLFDEEGSALALATRPTPTQRSAEGYAYDPEALWQQVVRAIQDVLQQHPATVTGIGVSSMAETGLLLDDTGVARTEFIPWFDRRTVPQADRLRRLCDVQERFYITGMRPSYKSAVAKLLWLQEQDAELLMGATWLSVADYLAFRLTGTRATDYSLAGRTYGYDIDSKAWDEEWLEAIGLSANLFPEVVPSGTVIGRVPPETAAATGLSPGASVVIGGHDHVCAAFAAGAIRSHTIFDSMGTAETLMGGLTQRELRGNDYESGLMFGCHTARHRFYWMGGLSTSGGSIEWLRAILGDPPLSYDALQQMLDGPAQEPSDILYFPYLAGSGSPHSDEQVRGAFVGLSSEHSRADLLQAVLEGTAYEMEWIRRTAAETTGSEAERIMVAGGGTRNRRWLQIKADVSGRPLTVLDNTEATLQGAALLAGLGSGLYNAEQEALALPSLGQGEVIEPDLQRHEQYRHLFETGYCPLQAPLRTAAARAQRQPVQA